MRTSASSPSFRAFANTTLGPLTPPGACKLCTPTCTSRLPNDGLAATVCSKASGMAVMPPAHPVPPTDEELKAMKGLDPEVKTIMQTARIPWWCIGKLVSQGITTLFDFADRWEDKEVCRLHCPQDMGIQDGRNGFNTYGAYKTTLRMAQAVELAQLRLSRRGQAGRSDILSAAGRHSALNRTECEPMRWVPQSRRVDWADKQQVIEHLQHDGHRLMYADPALRADRDVVFAAIRQNPHALAYAADELREDTAFMLEAVSINGSCVRFMSKDLIAHGDVEVLLKACEGAGESFNMMPERLTEQKEFALAACYMNGHSYECVNKDLQADRDILLSAVTSNGVALRHASEEQQADREVVLTAVAQNGTALRYASDGLKRSKSLALEVFARQPPGNIHLAFRHMADTLRADPEVAIAALKLSGLLLEFCPAHMQADTDFVTLACAQNGGAFRFAAQHLRRDVGFVLEMVKLHACCFEFAADSLRADREAVFAALQINGLCLAHVAKPLKVDIDVVRAAQVQNRNALKYADPTLATSFDSVSLSTFCQNYATLPLGKSPEGVDTEFFAGQKVVLRQDAPSMPRSRGQVASVVSYDAGKELWTIELKLGKRILVRREGIYPYDLRREEGGELPTITAPKWKYV